ncbi:outer membrane protein assembly factor BamA [Acuticoccus sp. I52.16.1]|uniref:outer membrane protein assembly factor BamA n=1 Tax=Acuticoccus sp. I52.16.1 TaxID=2928472 RepID=UPI001FD011BD|nr:outer membrane protein assembly factor BamA [Acuticoccus sp. I52.16.1]UOM34810.1 outer membrane protein assembly factor BamA [Acuticoccus sp. I52.16.1]
MFLRPGTMMQNLLRAIVLTVVMAAGLVSAGAPALAAVASSIVVQGNEGVSDETVRAYVTIEPGQSYGPRQIDESIDALFATGLFANVTIRQQGNTVVVTVVENATINRVSFEGNRKVKDEQLETIVQSRSRSVFSRGQVQSDTQRILEVYRRRGNYRASVEPQTIDRGQGRVDLIFMIDEGQKANVARITFVGNNSFSDSRLRDVIGTKESGLLGFLRTTDNYDPDRLQADQELIRRFYFNHGFADFRLLSATADYDRERNAFYITFTVDEGERYEFGTVRVDTTLADLSPEELERKVDSRPGRRYSAEKIEKSIEDLTLAANKQGYPFADVTPVGERNFETNKIDVVYRVDQGVRAYIERIDIVGNTTTRDYVIRREFDIAEGDAYNRVLLDRAERRLRALGFFESVRIATTQGSEPDRVVVTVFVAEQATGKISVGFGYSTDEGVVGEISIEERNFLGRGQYLKGALSGSFEKQSAEVSFTEPYLFGYRVSGGVDLFTRLSEDADDQDYDTNETGGTIRFGVPLTEETSVQVFYSLFNRDVSVDEQDCANGDISLAVCDSQGGRITSLIGTSLTYNSLDDQFNPREGLYGQIKGEVAGLGGDTYFVRGTAKLRGYHEVFPAAGVVGMGSLEGGAMAALNDDLRIQDQFFLGGSKVRGFSSAGIGPRDRATGEALGGRYYVAGTVEATFPVPFLPPEVGLAASAFADAGSLWGVDPDIIARNGGSGTINSDDFALRASVGVGLTWKSPFGPIRADVALPILEEDSDETQLFRLSGGTRF